MGLVKCTFCNHCVYKGDKNGNNYSFRCEAKDDVKIDNTKEPIKCYRYERP